MGVIQRWGRFACGLGQVAPFWFAQCGVVLPRGSEMLHITEHSKIHAANISLSLSYGPSLLSTADDKRGVR